MLTDFDLQNCLVLHVLTYLCTRRVRPDERQFSGQVGAALTLIRWYKSDHTGPMVKKKVIIIISN